MFGKKKDTEAKFAEEKRRNAVGLLIRVLRNPTIKVTKHPVVESIVSRANEIDPDHKMAERDLITALMSELELNQKLKQFLECQPEVLTKGLVR